ncbi:hypothetical protein ACIBKX_05375 [Streptomyces sp. NPDC050658]|uniref:hypothetical protein n=1 Tax=unclassified Streptomyces TaxID=2593676 RepID=UPI003443DAAC
MALLLVGCLPADDTQGADKTPDAPNASKDAGDGGDAKGSASPSESPSASPATEKPLTTAQLKALFLHADDVPEVDSAPTQGPVPKNDPPSVMAGRGCQGVYDALVMHDSDTNMIQDFWWQTDRWGGRTWLGSYAGDGAAEQFRGLADGLKTCKSLTGQTPEKKLDSRITVRKAPRLGDEAVAFDLSMDDAKGNPVIDRHIVVRVGGLTADFSDRGAQLDPRFPLETVIDKQLDRIKRAPRS